MRHSRILQGKGATKMTKQSLEAEIEELHLKFIAASVRIGGTHAWFNFKTALLKTVDRYVEERERLAKVDNVKIIRMKLIEQHKAANKNMQYQIENTGNENLIKNWAGSVQGIKFCIDTLDDMATLRQQDKEPKQ